MKSKKWMAFLLVGIFFLSGCGKPKESNLKVGNEVHRGLVKEEEKQEKIEEEKETEQETQEEEQDGTMYVVLQIDNAEQTIRLQSVETEKISEYGLSDATAYRDKYGDFTGSSQIVPGKIVTIGSANADGNLSYIQLSEKSWEQDNVKKFEVDTEKNIFTIGKTRYYFDDSLLVFLDGEQVSFDMITENDQLRIAGVDKKVSSVSVTSGHGFFVLTHTELFEGGWLAVGNECVLQIEKDMKVEVPEGTYQVSVANDGYGDTKEATVVRNETTVLNLEDYKGEGPKMGKVQFHLKPEDTMLTIDGNKVDTSQPVELKYGIHELVASSEKYGVYKEKLLVSSESVEITMDMKKMKEAREEEKEEKEEVKKAQKKSSSSNTKKSSSSSGRTSSGNSSSSSKDSSSSTKRSSSFKNEDTEEDTSALKKLSDFISTLLD